MFYVMFLFFLPLHAKECGSATEINPDGTCDCGTAVCGMNQYCNHQSSTCSNQPNPTCSETGITVPNMDSCLCSTEICSPESYCNPEATIKCHKQYCADYPDIDLLCQRTVLEGQTQKLYSNGVNDGNPQCAGTTCLPTDFDTCCKECTGYLVGVSNGTCSKQCDITCDGNYLMPPSQITSQHRVANPLYTGFCDGLTCSDNDRDTCCFKAPSCLLLSGEICSDTSIYSGELLNNTCQTVDCSNDAERCCEKLDCQCLNGTGVSGIYCPSSDTYKCAECDTEFWLNGDICQYATQCQTGEYEHQSLQSNQDRVCLSVTQCSTGQFIQMSETATSDRICKDWQVCDFIYQYDNSPPDVPNATEDRDCRNITQCNATEYQTQAPTTISNRICTPLTPECGPQQYESIVPNATTDRVCSTVRSPCSAGEYESQTPSKTQNRICLLVTNCSDSQYIVQEATNTSNRICKNKTECATNEWEFFEGNTTTDRECKRLTTCKSIEYEETPMEYYTRDRICLPLSVCNKTQYISTEATVTSDRICTQCHFEGCIGCTIEGDCAFSKIARALNPDSCSQHVCTTIQYHKNVSGVFFDPVDFILRDDQWFRFENRSVPINIEGINTTVAEDYQYFYVPTSLEGTIRYDGNIMPILQDCTYEFTWSLCANASSSLPECGPGTQTGFRGSKIKNAQNGGIACSTIPETLTRTCIGTRCPTDCIYDWSQWSKCDGPCGKRGTRYRYPIVRNKTKHNGLQCPTNQTETCITEPNDNGQPGDPCDCEGHVRDICGHCGGNGRVCLGCDGVVDSGLRYDKCGKCGGDGTSCTNRQKLQAKNKHHRSHTLAIGLPIGGASIFVIIVAAMLAYFSKTT